MPDSTPVAARVHPEVGDWLDEKAEKRKTTVGRVVEDLLSELYKEESGGSQSGGESGDLPKGVYRPDGEYNFAVKYERDGEVGRKYYKTRKSAIERAERERTVPV